MKTLFVDTSAWLAVVDNTDRYHRVAKEYHLGSIKRKASLVTSSDVLTETYTRLRYATGHRDAVLFHSMIEMAQQQGFLQVVWVNEEIASEAWKVFERYDDQVLSFQDCTSFVIARRSDIQNVFAFDEDFSIMGFTVWPRRSANGTESDLPK